MFLLNLHNKKWPLLVIIYASLSFAGACKKDNPLPEPEYRIAFWTRHDDGCGWIDVFVDGKKRGNIRYWQSMGPTTCGDSNISLSIPITKGKHTFLFTSSCATYTYQVEYEINKDCTLYEVK